MMEERQTVLRGELALLLAVVINSFGVVLMLPARAQGSPPFPACPMHFLSFFPGSPWGPGPISSRGCWC